MYPAATEDATLGDTMEPVFFCNQPTAAWSDCRTALIPLGLPASQPHALFVGLVGEGWEHCPRIVRAGACRPGRRCRR